MAALSGWATGFFLFDVGDDIDLAAARTTIGGAVEARLSPKQAVPPYVQFAQPPLTIDGTVVEAAEVAGFRVRFKVFDYGVISVALVQPLPDTWEELLARGRGWYESPLLPKEAERLSRSLVARLGQSVRSSRDDFLSEDYWVFCATRVAGAQSADDVLRQHGADLAQLLRGEREALSTQEREEVLRHRLSYLTNDLVVPTWNGAFVYDSETGAQAALEIIEFANSQLLQFRYYDRLLDAELTGIYSRLQRPRWTHTWFARRHARAARQVHALFIDVNELTDKTENALKIAGDVYAARLFALTAARLGLDQWKGNVRDKLKTLDDIYRFAVEQTSMTRGELLEAAIVAILIFELVLFFFGIMR